jgi:phage terminase small subunit
MCPSIQRMLTGLSRELGMTPMSRQMLKASGTNAALDLAAAAVE